MIASALVNEYYDTDDEYIEALADAMRVEYNLIHQAGFLLQIDCPDLAAHFHMRGDPPREEFLRDVEKRLEMLDHVTRDIPADHMRIHLCWGNYEGHHHHDLPLADILPAVLKARAEAIVFEAANPRHEHEWTVFEDIKLPDDKILIPGVVDTTTNFIEHPELVAQRLERYARLVGKERVIAGTDCGFASAAAMPTVYPDIAWAKLAAMAEGAKIATERLDR